MGLTSDRVDHVGKSANQVAGHEPGWIDPRQIDCGPKPFDTPGLVGPQARFQPAHPVGIVEGNRIHVDPHPLGDRRWETLQVGLCPAPHVAGQAHRRFLCADRDPSDLDPVPIQPEQQTRARSQFDQAHRRTGHIGARRGDQRGQEHRPVHLVGLGGPGRDHLDQFGAVLETRRPEGRPRVVARHLVGRRDRPVPAGELDVRVAEDVIVDGREQQHRSRLARPSRREQLRHLVVPGHRPGQARIQREVGNRLGEREEAIAQPHYSTPMK